MSKNYYVNITIALLLSISVYITSCSDLFFYNGKRIIEICLILFVLLSISISKNAQQILLNIIFTQQRPVFIFSLFILGIISASLSVQPRQSFIEVITFFSLFIIVIQVAPVWQKYPKITPWLGLALISSFAIFEIKFISYYVSFLLSDDQFSIFHFFFTFANPRFFNQYQIWTLALPTLALLIDHPLLHKTYVRRTLWGIAILWWTIFFASNSLGVIAASMCSAILSFIIFREKSKNFLQITCVLFILGFAISLFFINFIPYLQSENSFFSNDSVLTIQSYQERINSPTRGTYLWPKAVEYILANPWFGIGPMHYAWYQNDIAAHPHNSVLQIASEWGLPTLTIVLFLLYSVCKNWISKFNHHTLDNFDKNHHLAIIGLTFSIVSAALYSLVSGVIVMPMSHMMGVFTLSLALAIYQGKSSDSDSGLKKHNWLISISFASLAIVYFWLLSPALIPRVDDPSFVSDIKRDVRGPRFWLVGDISD